MKIANKAVQSDHNLQRTREKVVHAELERIRDAMVGVANF